MLKYDNKVNSLKRIIGEIEIEIDYIEDINHKKEKINELNDYKKELKSILASKRRAN